MRASLVAFDADKDVAELLRDAFELKGLPGIAYVAPRKAEPAREEYFRRVLRFHQPALVVTSWRWGVGPSVISAVKTLPADSRPKIWLWSGFDEEVLLEDGAMFRVDRVFPKPMSLVPLVEEARKFLADNPST